MSIDIVGLLIFTVYIIICAVFQIEPKAAIIVALVLLVAGAISLNIGKEAIANQLAMYSFFFLASGVVLLFIQYVRKGH